MSAVVPVFEEAGAIAWVVERLLRALAEAAGRYEVIVVAHEAALDGTPGRARELARRHSRVRVVLQGSADGGYGRALALGVAAARLPWIFLCDGDGQFDPLDFPLLASASSGVDLVAGVRAPRRDPWTRRAAARVYNRLLALLFGVRLRDADCAFKLFRRELLAPGLRLPHLADGEIAARLLRAGGRWREVEVPHHPRRGGRSRAEAAPGLPRPGLVLAVLRDMAALRREMGRVRREGRA